jgi:carboxyl-terminal processing protease
MIIAKKVFRRYVILSVALVVAVIFASYTFCKRDNKEQVLTDIVMQIVNEYHYSPLTINDTFSVNVYKSYLKHLDYSKLFLTKEDVGKLEVYKNQIDDEILSRNLEFYKIANELYSKSIDRAEGYYTEILSKPFTFENEESFQTDADKRDFAANEIALKEEWRKTLKYQVLTRIADMMEAQEKIKSDTIRKKTTVEMDTIARAKVRKMHADWFKRLRKTSDMDKFALYINSITGQYDPHTVYMPAEEKESFDISITGQLQGIGASLRERESQIEVIEIIPGSASYIQGELKAKDIILKVAQDKQEPVDVIDMPLEDAVQLIRGKKGTKVTLTVKKPDGTIKNITITRDIVIIEETYAKSSIINAPTGKVGYIVLPKFYANFEQTPTGRACATDIAKEIVKLKNEHVTGIILDLRNNLGGSLQEVQRMGGLFISKGPIVQVKYKGAAPMLLADNDPTIQYDGPLVVMINGGSASASEIMAAAMQDYHRAIIVGSNSFGKGTVQTQLNLDEIAGSLVQKMGKLGGMLVTIQKFYRVNGGATQLKGVTPDIAMPDPYSEIETGERELDFCMPWDKIAPASYTTWTGLPKFDQIVQSEKTELNANPDFKIIKEQALELKKHRDETVVSLNIEKYRKQETEMEAKSKKFEELAKKETGLTIEPMAVDINALKGDTIKLGLNKKWINDLKKDVYLKEAVNVIKLINTTK